MPWESRIRSESKRRLVIAVVMFVLLLLSAAAAAWLSAARSMPRTLGAVQWAVPHTAGAQGVGDAADAAIARVRVDVMDNRRRGS